MEEVKLFTTVEAELSPLVFFERLFAQILLLQSYFGQLISDMSHILKIQFLPAAHTAHTQPLSAVPPRRHRRLPAAGGQGAERAVQLTGRVQDVLLGGIWTIVVIVKNRR